MTEKLSTGPNARPKHETIAQSGEGLPDDSGSIPGEVSEADEAAARRSLEKIGQPQGEKEEAAEAEPKTKAGPGTAAGRTGE